jgi:hypothetical protein
VGDAIVVNWYRVVKLAVYVVALAGTVMVWLIAPPSLQLENIYLVPPDPCGVVVAIVWLLPTTQEKT